MQAQRMLSGVATAGLVVVSACGIAGFAASPEPASLNVAAALGAAMLGCLLLLALGERAGARVERELDADVSGPAGHPHRQDPPRAAAPPLPGARASTKPRRFMSSAARRGVAVAASVAAIAGIAYFVAPPSISRHRWTFTGPASAPAELGLRAHVSGSGAWEVEDHSHATGARALVNRAGDPSGAPALIVGTRTWARDLHAVTRCKVSPLLTARACGVVFRFRDEDNYHAARLDTAAGALIVSVTTAGRERILGRLEAVAAPGVWQELGVEVRGRRIRLSWNGERALDIVDSGPVTAGGVGLWAPAAGVAYFDELTVDPS